MKKEQIDARVLIIEDNQQVRDTIERFLAGVVSQVNGYRTPGELFASDQALLASANLVICDIVLPEMNGIELVSKLMKINNKMKIIFITGYDHPAHNNINKLNEIPHILLRKPFGIEALRQAVDQTLS